MVSRNHGLPHRVGGLPTEEGEVWGRSNPNPAILKLHNYSNIHGFSLRPLLDARNRWSLSAQFPLPNNVTPWEFRFFLLDSKKVPGELTYLGGGLPGQGRRGLGPRLQGLLDGLVAEFNERGVPFTKARAFRSHATHPPPAGLWGGVQAYLDPPLAASFLLKIGDPPG